jgi:hypothetical protein
MATGLSQNVITRVINAEAAATKPTGNKSRRKLIPQACSATISLSAERRPSPISTPTSTAIGSVKVRTGGSEQRKSFATVHVPPEWRTIKSISRTSCGTKKTKVNTARPRMACDATSRVMYRSSRRIFAPRHSSTGFHPRRGTVEVVAG